MLNIAKDRLSNVLQYQHLKIQKLYKCFENIEWNLNTTQWSRMITLTNKGTVSTSASSA